MYMSKSISLRAITKANWQRVAGLSVSSEQRQFVADNSYSIAEDAYYEHSVAQAIYLGDDPVGFVMYEDLGWTGRPGEYNIYRFMVDQYVQAGGIGRAALKMVIDDLLATENVKRITICYIADNDVARSFYSSLGFSEVGRSASGEMIAEIRV
jgi:diamine N-acetyltransferase